MHPFFGPLFGFVIAGLVVICGFILLMTRILRGPSSDRPAVTSDPDETQMIQEIYQGLSRMEKRVDALETLLLDADRKEGD